jgi:hypothetical protein
MTFGVDPDTHIDSLEQAENSTIEGTSKWSCKITITGIITTLNSLFPIVFLKFITRTSSTSTSTMLMLNKKKNATHPKICQIRYKFEKFTQIFL